MAIAPTSVTNSSNPLPSPLAPLVIASDTRSYSIVRQLGEGVQAQVWEVLTPRGVNHLAAKIFLSQHPSATASNEIRSLRAIEGIPHVLEYMGKFALNDTHYEDQRLSVYRHGDRDQMAILTKMLQGPDCFGRFLDVGTQRETQDKTRVSKLSFADVMDIGGQALETLEGLDARGYIHRDIKPENMHYNPSTKTFTMLDFGSMIMKSSVRDARPEGVTINCLAPECMLCTSYNETIDIWSLGVSLFTLYTGEPLIYTDDLNDPSQLNADYFHQLFFNMGEVLPRARIELASRASGSIQDLFRRVVIKQSDGSELVSYTIPLDPSKPAKVWLGYQGRSKVRKQSPLLAGEYAGMKPWQARIYEAAVLKGESPSHAKALIDVLGPMLRYENRVTASVALRHLRSLPDVNNSPEASSSKADRTPVTVNIHLPPLSAGEKKSD